MYLSTFDFISQFSFILFEEKQIRNMKSNNVITKLLDVSFATLDPNNRVRVKRSKSEMSKILFGILPHGNGETSKSN